MKFMDFFVIKSAFREAFLRDETVVVSAYKCRWMVSEYKGKWTSGRVSSSEFV